jgi:hypothetical protein
MVDATAGTPGFVLACRAVFEALGGSRARVHTEVFFAERQPCSVAA